MPRTRRPRAGSNQPCTAACRRRPSALPIPSVPGRLAGSFEIVQFEPPDGVAFSLYLDRVTGLPAKAVRKPYDDLMITVFDDWRPVNGIQVPHALREFTSADSTESVTVLESVELGHKLGTAQFAAPKPGERDYRFASGRTALGIPFNFENDHIMIECSVNGRPPLWFMLDSGAGWTCINKTRLAEFGLETFGERSVAGGGNFTDLSFTRVETMQVGGVEMLHQRNGVLDMNGLERLYGMPMGGILGYDFMSRFVIHVDYATKTIDVGDPAAGLDAGKGEKIPIVFERNHPHVRGVITVPGVDPISADFVVDSGAAETANLTSPFVKQHRLTELARKTPAGKPNTLAGLESQFFAQTTVRGKLATLALGSFVMDEIPVNLQMGTKGFYSRASFSGTIGEGILNASRRPMTIRGEFWCSSRTPSSKSRFNPAKRSASRCCRRARVPYLQGQRCAQELAGRDDGLAEGRCGGISGWQAGSGTASGRPTPSALRRGQPARPRGDARNGTEAEHTGHDHDGVDRGMNNTRLRRWVTPIVGLVLLELPDAGLTQTPVHEPASTAGHAWEFEPRAGEQRFNRFVYKASHNSFERRESLNEQIDTWNVWSLELDLWCYGNQILVAHQDPCGISCCPCDAPDFGSRLDEVARAATRSQRVTWLDLQLHVTSRDAAAFCDRIEATLRAKLGSERIYRAAEFAAPPPHGDGLRWPSSQELVRRGKNFIIVAHPCPEHGFFFRTTTTFPPSKDESVNAVLAVVENAAATAGDLGDRYLSRTWHGSCLGFPDLRQHCNCEIDDDFWNRAIRMNFNFIATYCIDRPWTMALPIPVVSQQSPADTSGH
jgi:hypothetical protein